MKKPMNTFTDAYLEEAIVRASWEQQTKEERERRPFKAYFDGPKVRKQARAVLLELRRLGVLCSKPTLAGV